MQGRPGKSANRFRSTLNNELIFLLGLALDRLDVVHAAAIPMRAEPTATWPARLVEQVGTRGLDVHNHAKLHIDEIVIGVGVVARYSFTARLASLRGLPRAAVQALS